MARVWSGVDATSLLAHFLGYFLLPLQLFIIGDVFWMALSHPTTLEPPIALNTRYCEAEHGAGQDNSFSCNSFQIDIF